MGKTPVSASWQKRFSDHLAALSFLKKVRVQRIFSSSQLNCSRAECKYSIQELKKAQLELHLLKKSGRKRSFGLAHCLDRAARTGGDRLTGGKGANTGGGAGAELVMS